LIETTLFLADGFFVVACGRRFLVLAIS
jgi:hypothetical protein